MDLIKLNSFENVENMLELENSLVFKESDSNSSIVIAAPHHINNGQKIMYDNSNGKKYGDPNTGVVAYKIAQNIDCNLIIYVKPDHDANKIDGLYCRRILDFHPKYLIEIHTHWKNGKSGRKLTDKDIEISSGSQIGSYFSTRFAQKLQEKMLDIKVDGDYSKIFYKASRTYSLKMCREKGIMPLHIEIYKDLISDENKGLQSSTISSISKTIENFLI